ncbi:MAG: hypothetical protein HPY45_15020 [Anaerolineae bacterium]|nr:hypothetical protein [Anaerolineae bacterium]
MKAKLQPLYFQSAEDPDFVKQMGHLQTVLAEEAEFLPPKALGEKPPAAADAVIFPQMLGDAYRRVDQIRAIKLPRLVITSEFGTVSMWDWEINSYLASLGIAVMAPYNLDQARHICRSLALKKELKSAKFLVYQDNPGEGFQAEIFKRFYWWEEECIRSLTAKFGFTLVKKSFKELAERAKAIPDAQAKEAWRQRKDNIPVEKLSEKAIYSAMKVYLALKQDLEADPDIVSAGINCLNESAYSDTTPCLAWNLLFEEQKLVWGCEADLVVMVTEYLVHKALGVPFMMTNLYPFLMGMAALKHERIPAFPQVDERPQDHILMAHCGYLGVVPQSFATQWKVNEKVLAIVDDNAHALDARLPKGAVTLVKLLPPFDRLSVVQGDLVKYAQFPGSDCRNGAVVRVANGHRMVKDLASHHYIVTVGDNLPSLEYLAQVFDLQCQVLS